MAAFYLKAGVQLPRTLGTLKPSVVLRWGKYSKRLMTVEERHAPRWGGFPSACRPGSFSSTRSTLTPIRCSAKLSECRRGAQTSRASWAGNPGVWTDQEDSQALGLLSPGDPGHPAGNHCGKEASARPCHGARPYFQGPNSASIRQGASSTHGLT